VILVDTSVWIDHLHKTVVPLAEALERGEVLTHPFIVGELACGGIRNRDEVLRLLDALPMIAAATNDEVRWLIEARRLMGKGLGFVDVHLIASVIVSEEARLWTSDKRLSAVARGLRIAHR
jgi:predicted nucleic acid-binding protein